jgi:hypothetical protein
MGGMHGDRFGDLSWINEQIDKLPINLQTYTRDKYSDIYNELLESDKNNVRYRVNTWLRKIVKKHGLTVDKNDLMF